MSNTRIVPENVRPGICDGKNGITVWCWRPGDSLAGSERTIRRVSKGRWDAKEQTEMITITWDDGAKSYLSGYKRRHLARCAHVQSATQSGATP